MLGGPGTPGVLCIKRKLLGNPIPSQPGGGTVLLVNNNEHIYLENPEEREEGGTPDIIGSIRLGLVFQLRSQIGDEYIMKTELKHYETISKRLSKITNLVVLGGPTTKRLPIFSFIIKFDDKLLHFGFISALLNDLFGIESRGGCACAGPYTLRLLNISEERAEKYKNIRIEGYELLYPGFTRLSINYFFSKYTIEYIIGAIEFISKYAIYFLPLYEFSPYKKMAKYKNSCSSNNSGVSLNLFERSNSPTVKKAEDKDLKKYMAKAYKTLEEVKTRLIKDHELEAEFELPEEAEKLRWFVLPSEAAKFAREKSETNQKHLMDRKIFKNSTKRTLVYSPRNLMEKHAYGSRLQVPGMGFGSHSRDKLPPLSKNSSPYERSADRSSRITLKLRENS